MRSGSALFAVLLCLLFTALAYDGNLNGGLDLFHEGERLAHYDTIAAGGLPFRDCFIPHGLGEDVLKPLLACKLSGESVASLRRLGQNSFVSRGWLPPLGVLALILAAWALLRSRLWVTLFAMAISAGLFEISERYAFAFLAIAAAGMYAARGNRRWLAANGALIGAAALYSTDTGIYALAATVAWLVLFHLRIASESPAPAAARIARDLGAAALGLAAVLVPFLAWCAAKGIASDFGQNLYIQVFLRKEIWPSSYPSPRWVAAAPLVDRIRILASVLILFYLIPLLCVASVALSLKRTALLPVADRASLCLAGLTAGLFWLSVAGRPDRWHVAYAAGSVFLMLAVAAKATASFPGRAKLFARLAILCTLAPLLLYGDGGMLLRHVSGKESTAVPRELSPDAPDLQASSLPRVGPVALPAAQQQLLATLVQYIHNHSRPEDTILDLTNQGLIYFLAQRRCPTRFHYLAHCDTPELRRQMLEEIGRGPLPALVLASPGLQDPRYAEIRAFLAQHYRKDAVLGPVEVFLKSS